MPKKAKYQRKSTTGSITHASGRGEKCWRAAVTFCGKKKHIGWFASEEEADNALYVYEHSRAEILKNITFKEVYQRWYGEYLKKEVRRHSRKEGYPVDPYDVERNSSFSNYKAAFNNFEEFHNVKFADITKKQLKKRFKKRIRLCKEN